MMRRQSSSKYLDAHPIRVRRGQIPDPTKDSPYRKEQEQQKKMQAELQRKEREAAALREKEAQRQAQMKPQD
jgi:hypothetical protein